MFSKDEIPDGFKHDVVAGHVNILSYSQLLSRSNWLRIFSGEDQVRAKTSWLLLLTTKEYKDISPL